MPLVSTVGAIASGTTGCSPIYPTGVAVGDMLAVHAVSKYSPNLPTLAGWTTPTNGQVTAGSGASGADSGNATTTLFLKIADAADAAASAASGTVSVVHTGGNAIVARMTRYTRTALTTTWDYACVTGTDTTAGTDWSVTGNATLPLAAGDSLIAFNGANSDLGAAGTPLLSVPGITTGGVTGFTSTSGQGDDVSIFSGTVQARTGSATGAPTYSATISASGANARAGGCVFLRLREVGAVDGPDGWKVPIAGSEFEDAGEVIPAQVFGFQEASGTVFNGAYNTGTTSSVSVAGGGAVGATILLQQSVTGWTRKALGAADGDSATIARSQGGFYTIATTSFALSAIMAFPSLPAAERPIMGLSAPTTTNPVDDVRLYLRTDGRLTLRCNGNAATGAINYVDGDAHWICFYYNRTGGIVAVQTDRELITGTYASIGTSGNVGFGFVQQTLEATAEFRLLWAMVDQGAGAERDWRAFLEHMGVAVTDPPIELAGNLAAAATLTATLHVRRAMAGSIQAVSAISAALEVREAPPHFEDFTTTVELVEHPASVEIDLPTEGTMYVIKAGDLLPGIAGRITVPSTIDLTDAALYMTFRGRNAPAVTVAVVNDGLAEGSPEPGNEDGAATTWAWHHDWDAGETSIPDRYSVGISTRVGGLQITLPNSNWAEFVIQSQLTTTPVP